MPASRLALVPCNSYRRSDVYSAVCAGIEALGGLAAILGGVAGKRVLLKPNLLVADPPEKGSTTHPAVFYAVARRLKEAGFEVSYGDCPAFGSLGRTVQKSGFQDTADSLGIALADFESGQAVRFPQGRRCGSFTIARAALEADAVINLPKLKTHGLTIMSGAIKNMYGAIPGVLKSELHIRFPDPADFCGMLVDLNRLLRPSLTIMDAVQSMEGNGPRNGTPFNTGLLILSTDPVAVDATAARIMGLRSGRIPGLLHAQESGLGNCSEAGISIRGEALGRFLGRPFRLSAAPGFHTRISPLVRPFRGLLVPRPVIAGALCRQCGICLIKCPVRPPAISREDGRAPEFDYGRCIRCTCCQEICPEGAISIQRPLSRLWRSD